MTARPQTWTFSIFILPRLAEDIFAQPKDILQQA